MNHLDHPYIMVYIVNDPKCTCCSPIDIHYLLKCQLYYNGRISLFNDLINFNVHINIETLLFGIDAYNDQTNSFFLEKVRFFLSNRQEDVDTPSQQL